MTEVLPQIRNGLIVSCQAPPGSPLNHPEILAAMAKAAELAGAVAIRADGVQNIKAIKRETALPVLGIKKVRGDADGVYITRSLADALEIVEAGAEIIALDATLRPRSDGSAAATLIPELRRRGVVVMADIDNLAAAKAAASVGVDLLGTTLSGYTDDSVGSNRPSGPDVGLVTAITTEIPGARVVAEGRYSTPADVVAAFTRGAFAVVVGTAITDPLALATNFVKAAKQATRQCN